MMDAADPLLNIMAIQSNYQLIELNNPFYIANKKRCEEFEKYILKQNGQVIGEFNAWSY